MSERSNKVPDFVSFQILEVQEKSSEITPEVKSRHSWQLSFCSAGITFLNLSSRAIPALAKRQMLVFLYLSSRAMPALVETSDRNFWTYPQIMTSRSYI